MPCFWETSVEDGYVESLRSILSTVSVRDSANISNVKKNLKCVDALFSQVYILPGLFGPSHLYIDGYFKAIYLCRTQLTLSKSVLSAAKEREDIKSFSLSVRKMLKLISSEGNTDYVVEAANIPTAK